MISYSDLSNNFAISEIDNSDLAIWNPIVLIMGECQSDAVIGTLSYTIPSLQRVNTYPSPMFVFIHSS